MSISSRSSIKFRSVDLQIFKNVPKSLEGSGGTKRDKQLLQNKEESCLDDVKPGEGVLPRALRCLFRTLGTTSDQMADVSGADVTHFHPIKLF